MSNAPKTLVPAPTVASAFAAVATTATAQANVRCFGVSLAGDNDCVAGTCEDMAMPVYATRLCRGGMKPAFRAIPDFGLRHDGPRFQVRRRFTR